MNFPRPSNDPPLSPTARIWSPEHIGKYHLIVLGQWQGHWVHWVGRRSEPCLETDCPKSRHRRPLSWRGYTPCALFECEEINTTNGTWKSVILSLGTDNARILEAHLGAFPGPGLLLTKPDKTNKIVIETRKLKAIPEGLPECPDVTLTLARVWGLRISADRQIPLAEGELEE